ncbi:hypothetical protein L7H23_01105 [Sphingopyxis sp. BSN-002]|uniref:hypothetical protein n=1 Tax=Sphingopyxis sp. BSN-002 TaxID=2911495 RepID=UPI001EDA0674|nr:hypothetical protein [Sphingopyxis sp. BSN-002]UKK84731.1 hypothetical protein L7H23_01105 [Sphingopyxis sp. BSN-002]
MLTTEEFLAEIRLRAGKDAEVGRALGLPSSRVAELFSGKRRLLYHEAKTLADRFMPEESGASISAEKLAPILAACLRLAPKDGWSESEAPRLARAVEYGLGLLASAPANQDSDDAVAVAGQAAMLRLRESRLEA